MVVRYGRTVEEGFLPLFSVDTEQEARDLITLTCPRDNDGTYYARELVQEQTLENLYALTDKMRTAYDRMQRSRQ